jgi:hypothetical protein
MRAGSSTARDTQRFLDLGFDAMLPKPFDIQDMHRALVGARARRNLMIASKD